MHLILNRIYTSFCCLYIAWHRFVEQYVIKIAFGSAFVLQSHPHNGSVWCNSHLAGTWSCQCHGQRAMVKGSVWCWPAEHRFHFHHISNPEWVQDTDLSKFAPAHALTEYLYQLLNPYLCNLRCKYWPLLQYTLIKSHKKSRTAQIKCGNRWGMDIF